MISVNDYYSCCYTCCSHHYNGTTHDRAGKGSTFLWLYRPRSISVGPLKITFLSQRFQPNPNFNSRFDSGFTWQGRIALLFCAGDLVGCSYFRRHRPSR